MKKLSLLLVSVALFSFVVLSSCKSKTQQPQEQIETESVEQETTEAQPQTDTAAQAPTEEVQPQQ